MGLKLIEHGSKEYKQMIDNLQGKGIGASIMSFAESISKDKGYNKIVMNARNNAIGFYEKFGYKVKSGEFIQYNTPHHVMEKILI